MKKLMAILLAAMLALGCAAAAAEESVTTIKSADGSFQISFQLPEGGELLYGEWVSDDLYCANIKGNDGLYFYLAVAAPIAAEGEDDEETEPVTFSEEYGYTDEFIKEMLNELYADDAESYDTGVETTAYGTKLAVVRVNDPEDLHAYIFSTWKGYEVGVTAVCMDEDGTYKPVTDDMVQRIVDFLSEVWMEVTAEEDNAA